MTDSQTLTWNFIIHGCVDLEATPNTAPLIKRICELLKDSGVTVEAQVLELPKDDDSMQSWATLAHPEVLLETLRVVRVAMRNTEQAWHLTAKTLANVLAQPFVAFGSLDSLVSMQRTLRDRAVRFSGMAKHMTEAAVARGLLSSPPPQGSAFVDFLKCAALDVGARDWIARPDLGAQQQVLDAADRVQGIDLTVGDELEGMATQLVECTFRFEELMEPPSS